jgi:hypothetical protein
MDVPKTSSPITLCCVVEPHATPRALDALRGGDREPCVPSAHWLRPTAWATQKAADWASVLGGGLAGYCGHGLQCGPCK